MGNEMDRHIDNHNLKIYIQNKNGNFELEKIDSNIYQSIEMHLEACDVCKFKFEECEIVYKEIESISALSVTNRRNYFYVAAAVLLLVISPLVMQSNDLNKSELIELHEFGFKISRGVSSIDTTVKNRIVYLINEKKYDEAIVEISKSSLPKKNVYAFAATLLKAQEEDNEALLKQSLSYLKPEDQEKWQKRLDKVLN